MAGFAFFLEFLLLIETVKYELLHLILWYCWVPICYTVTVVRCRPRDLLLDKDLANFTRKVMKMLETVPIMCNT